MSNDKIFRRIYLKTGEYILINEEDFKNKEERKKIKETRIFAKELFEGKTNETNKKRKNI